MDASELRAFLADKFDDAELRTLAFDLRIPWEDLSGAEQGKLAHIQALLEWCGRRERLAELAQAAVQARTAVSTHPYAVPVPASAMIDWGPASAERVMRIMDELRDDVTQLLIKMEAQNQRLAMLEKHLDRFIEHPQAVGWQTWAVAVVGLLLAVVLLYTVGQLLLGGH